MERVPSELDPLIASLNGMLAGLESSFQRLSQLTADLAHDMRTPLANMRGSTEVALARPRSVEEYQALPVSNVEECERLSRMIENVLFLARAEHPQFTRPMREFDADEELRRIAEYFEGPAEDAGVRIVVCGSDRVTADVELFRRAVSNLLANAVRYTPRKGIIHAVGAREPRARARMRRKRRRADRRGSGSPSSGPSWSFTAAMRTPRAMHSARASCCPFLMRAGALRRVPDASSAIAQVVERVATHYAAGSAGQPSSNTQLSTVRRSAHPSD
ncbi:heavy metal sensor signal transduction histidine kinase [Caballeronia ptereochthonis]|uniref:histidine kinase n=1 Tax=Caballeronia ptereochthonis TaxID=1777144 RepID=A0A158A0I3_9BURK|nr:heavy metal sensor signal transduction histidine kinase [Caballeronia ptereochthonis]